MWCGRLDIFLQEALVSLRLVVPPRKSPASHSMPIFGFAGGSSTAGRNLDLDKLAGEFPRSPRHRAERTAREGTRDDGIAHHVRERRIGRG